MFKVEKPIAQGYYSPIAATKFHFSYIADNYKTELCHYYKIGAQCPFQRSCCYAHGVEELRPRREPPNYKVIPCKWHWSGLFCKYADKCVFYHSLTEKRGEWCSMDPVEMRPKVKFETEVYSGVCSRVVL